jgi:beta-glucanase (GH16 family)
MKKKNHRISLPALFFGLILISCTPSSKSGASGTMISPGTEHIGPEYHLLWNDEFEGGKLDTSNWNIELRNPGWTNNELQEYTGSEKNVFVHDGCLVLKALHTKTGAGKEYYTSGKVNSRNKRDFQYGKVVVRAKVPAGKGLWPAIWMMPNKESLYGQWPRCGEVDIMEILGSETNRMYGTLHYGVPHKQNQGTVRLDKSSFADEFHEFSIEWEPGEIRWLLDGKKFLTVNDWFTAAAEDAQEAAYPAPFNQPFFVQMNLAVGGTWPGNPDKNTNFNNAEFLIDYVRVYQLNNYDVHVQKPKVDVTFRKPDETGNFINNGDFAVSEEMDDSKDWIFLLFGKGEGSAEIRENMLVVSTKNPGKLDYAVQIVHPLIPMVKGNRYKITFKAKADSERTGIVTISAPEVNWIRYFPDTKFDLKNTWQTYTYIFEMNKKDDPHGRLEFNLGNQPSSATVYITNVRVEEVK